MTTDSLTPEVKAALIDYIQRVGDDQLVLGHRISEWTGHAPILEEDIAMANLALDCIGQANYFLNLAGELEGQKRNSDKLAYFRDVREFKNSLLVEQPNGDFAQTMLRQFFFDAFAAGLFTTLAKSSFAPLAALAEKALKETKYHLRHSSNWVMRLGDGTDESHSRLENALAELWMFTGELFEDDAVTKTLAAQKICPLPSSLRAEWDKLVAQVFSEAKLKSPAKETYMQSGGRSGQHSEHLGYILAEMQILPRTHPDATW